MSELMRDLPRTSGNVFYLYSNASAGRSPRVEKSPAITARTGIASVSGGLDNADLQIAWSNGGWSITQKAATGTQCVHTFTVTVTTSGDATHSAASVAFEFWVVMVGSDHVFDYLYFDCRVGDKFRQHRLALRFANPLLSYRKTGALRSWDGSEYTSGLSVSIVEEDDQDVVYLNGTAARPGIYLMMIDATTDNVGQFAGGSNMAAPLVVAIRDKDYEGDQVVRFVRSPILHNLNALRIVFCNDDIFPSRSGDFCIRLNGGGGNWSAHFDETIGTRQYRAEWQITRSGSVWALAYRYYDIEEAAPAFTVWSTAVAIEGSDIPPSAGWSATDYNDAQKPPVITGDTRYYLPGVGLFDCKAETICQLQEVYTKQFDGWDNRPGEYTRTSGELMIMNADGEWTLGGEVVEPQPIEWSVVPYGPGCYERIGNAVVRDFAFGSLGVNAPLSGLVLTDRRYAGKAFNWFDCRRFFPPYNGSSGDEIQHGRLSLKVTNGSYNKAGAKTLAQVLPSGNQTECSVTTMTRDVETGGSGEWTFDGDLPIGERSGAFPTIFLSADDPGQTSFEHYLNGSYSEVTNTTLYPLNHLTTTVDVSTIYNKDIETVTPSTQIPFVKFCMAASPEATEDRWHNAWAICHALGAGALLAWTDKYTTTTTTTQYGLRPDLPGYPEVTTYTRTSTPPGEVDCYVNYFTAIPKRVLPGDILGVVSQTERWEQGTFEGTITDYDIDYTAANAYTVRKWKTITIQKDIYYLIVDDVEKPLGGEITWTIQEIPAGNYANLPTPTTTTGSTTDLQVYFDLQNEFKNAVKNAVLTPNSAGTYHTRQENEWTDTGQFWEVTWE